MYLTRRHALRAAAATLWLPFLPSLGGRAAHAASAEPKRLLVYFVPNGLIFGEHGDSGDPDPYGVLDPLDVLSDRRLVVTGLNNLAASQDHPGSTASLLSDVTPTMGGGLYAGASCDQVAAAQVGTSTPFTSLQLSPGSAQLPPGAADATYMSRLSWSSPRSPLSPISSPRRLYEAMFAGFDPSETQREARQRQRLRTSVLDAVLEHVGDVERRLDAADRRKLDQYTTSVRELEHRIQALEASVCDVPDRAPPPQLPLDRTVEVMADLMVLALECDHTRFLTFMAGPSSSDDDYRFLGISGSHHGLSHAWTYDAESKDMLVAIQRWHASIVARVASSLEEVVLGDGSDLLAHTMVVFCSEFSNPSRHLSRPLPFALVGGEAGGVRTGRHLHVPADRSHGELLRSFIRFTGADPGDFGENADEELDLS